LKLAQTSTNLGAAMTEDDVQVQAASGVVKYFIATPYSISRLCWDIAGMLVFLLCDLLVQPLTIFPLNDDFNDIVFKLNWFSAVFWSLDMMAGFTAGYMDGSHIIMKPHLIAKRYLKSWFWIDLSVLVIEWLSVIFVYAAQSSDVTSYGSLLKIMKVARLIRLLRYMKMKKVLRKFDDLITTEYTTLILQIGKLAVFLLILSHVIACIFYYVGNASRRDHQLNWIDALDDHSLAFQYASAMHWSLTQFTPASTNVDPKNTNERIFNMCIVVLGVFVFSGLISSITNSLLHLRRLSEEETRQFRMLRRYLAERDVPTMLSARIMRYVEKLSVKQGRRVQEHNVEMLHALTDGLRRELEYAIKVRHVVDHTLFDFMKNVSNATMIRLATAMDRTLMASGDFLYFQNEDARSMYCVVGGHLQFQREGIMGHARQMDVGSEDWICEAALWMPWRHLGDLHAFTDCDLIAIDSSKFGEVIKANPHVCLLVARYAKAFLQQFCSLDPSSLSDVVSDGGANADLVNYKHLRDVLEKSLNGEPIVTWSEWQRGTNLSVSNSLATTLANLSHHHIIHSPKGRHN
jgi:hypothetical protein